MTLFGGVTENGITSECTLSITENIKTGYLK